MKSPDPLAMNSPQAAELNDEGMQLKIRFRPFVLVFLGIVLSVGNSCDSAPQVSDPPRNAHETHLTIPHTLVAEHEVLHRELQDAINSGGETGKAAALVADRLGPHFVKEEEYALPPLALLGPLSQERTGNETDEVMKLSEKMSSELPQMLNEHKAITEALDRLADSARREDKPGAIEFSERLRQHARTEEEILYPAAILVGKYLKLRMERGAQPAP